METISRYASANFVASNVQDSHGKIAVQRSIGTASGCRSPFFLSAQGDENQSWRGMDQGCSCATMNLTRSLIDIFREENRFHPKVGQLSVGVFGVIANRRNSARLHRLAGIGIGAEWTSRGQVTGPFLSREQNAFLPCSGIGRQFRRSQEGQLARLRRRIIRRCPRVESCSNKMARQTSKSYRNKTRMTVCTPLVNN